jgi:hypothetical protein
METPRLHLKLARWKLIGIYPKHPPARTSQASLIPVHTIQDHCGIWQHSVLPAFGAIDVGTSQVEFFWRHILANGKDSLRTLKVLKWLTYRHISEELQHVGVEL